MQCDFTLRRGFWARSTERRITGQKRRSRINRLPFELHPSLDKAGADRGFIKSIFLPQMEPFVLDAEVNITALEKTVQILSGAPTRVWGYEGQLVSGSGVTVQCIPGSYRQWTRTSSSEQVRYPGANRQISGASFMAPLIVYRSHLMGFSEDRRGPGFSSRKMRWVFARGTTQPTIRSCIYRNRRSAPLTRSRQFRDRTTHLHLGIIGMSGDYQQGISHTVSLGFASCSAIQYPWTNPLLE